MGMRSFLGIALGALFLSTPLSSVIAQDTRIPTPPVNCPTLMLCQIDFPIVPGSGPNKDIINVLDPNRNTSAILSGISIQIIQELIDGSPVTRYRLNFDIYNLTVGGVDLMYIDLFDQGGFLLYSIPMYLPKANCGKQPHQLQFNGPGQRNTAPMPNIIGNIAEMSLPRNAFAGSHQISC
jgi:hypothetical protein